MESFFSSTPVLVALAVFVTIVVVLVAVFLYEKRTSKPLADDITNDLKLGEQEIVTELAKAHTGAVSVIAALQAKIDKLESGVTTAASSAAAAASSAAVSAAVTSIEQSLAAHSTAVAAALAPLKSS